VTLAEPGQVDAIALNRDSGVVSLTILDPWDWDNEANHLSALSEKINRYLGFVESGELTEAYPRASGRNVEILVVGRYPLPQIGSRLLEHAAVVARDYGVALRFEHRPGSN
jgi:Family of unknown function (DUF6572)